MMSAWEVMIVYLIVKIVGRFVLVFILNKK